MYHLTLLSLLPVIATAGLVPRDHIVHERRTEQSTKWVKRDRIASHIKLPVRIGLKQNGAALDQAAAWLMEASHPESNKYGQHWTQDEIVEAFRPASEAVDAVMAWIEQAAGVQKQQIKHTENKAWLAFDASTEQLEALTHAEYHEHHHEPSGSVRISCDEYHIPKHLEKHIDYITPGVKGINVANEELRKRSHKPSWKPPGKPYGWKPFKHRPAPHMPKHSSELATCDIAITPACIQALYQFKPLNPHTKVSSNNSMGIFEEGDFYAQEDLNSFFTNFTSYIPNGTHPTLDSIDGGYAPIANLADAGGESDLDFELAIPIIYPQTTTLYQTDDLYYAEGGNGSTYGIFNTFFDAIDGSYCTYSAYGETGNDPALDPTYPDPNGYTGNLMCGVYKPTNVISISYGEQESDLPYYYQRRQCNEFLKLGLQGVSIFVASGDTGASSLPAWNLTG
nr:aorsin [Quercus suber]